MKAWEDLLSALEVELGAETIQQWLRPIKVIRFDAANLYLEATPFQINWFEEQIRPRIGSFSNNNQRPIKIHWTSANNHSPKTVESEFCIVPDTTDPELRIENFIGSEPNRMAFEMAKELCQNDKCLFNPVFFSGPTGSGKTHLLTAIANALTAKGKNVFLVNAANFTEHVVQAIRLGRMLEFRKVYREIDVLIVDDIQLFARRSATQEEFFHTFNALHTQQKPIILGAQIIPSELQDIEPRLISRFEWGITLQLDPPSIEILREILIRKAHQLDLRPPEELFNYLLHHFSSQPAASIEALHAIALRCPHNLDIRHLENVLSDLLHKESAATVTADKIIDQTALFFGIRREDLTGSSQMREYAQPRQIAMFLCRNTLQLSFQEIGRIFDRDHSTVITSVRQIKNAIDNKDQKFLEPVLKISQDLRLGKINGK